MVQVDCSCSGSWKQDDPQSEHPARRRSLSEGGGGPDRCSGASRQRRVMARPGTGSLVRVQVRMLSHYRPLGQAC